MSLILSFTSTAPNFFSLSFPLISFLLPSCISCSVLLYSLYMTKSPQCATLDSVNIQHSFSLHLFLFYKNIVTVLIPTSFKCYVSPDILSFHFHITKWSELSFYTQLFHFFQQISIISRYHILPITCLTALGHLKICPSMFPSLIKHSIDTNSSTCSNYSHSYITSNYSVCFLSQSQLS